MKWATLRFWGCFMIFHGIFRDLPSGKLCSELEHHNSEKKTFFENGKLWIYLRTGLGHSIWPQSPVVFLNMFIIELNGQGLAMSGNQKLPGGKRNNRDAPNTPGSFGGQLGTYVSVKNHQVTFQKRPSFMAWRKLESYEIPSGRLTVCYWKWP